MNNSSKKPFKLEALRQLLKEENTLENWCEQSLGLTEDEAVAEHEQEYRMLMADIEQLKVDSIHEFLQEVKSQEYQLDLLDEPQNSLSEDVYYLYKLWCELAGKQVASYKVFTHELYKLGYVTVNVEMIGVDMTYGIGVEQSVTEIGLNLAPNPNALF
jgi:hypothetical protein